MKCYACDKPATGTRYIRPTCGGNCMGARVPACDRHKDGQVGEPHAEKHGPNCPACAHTVRVMIPVDVTVTGTGEDMLRAAIDAALEKAEMGSEPAVNLTDMRNYPGDWAEVLD